MYLLTSESIFLQRLNIDISKIYSFISFGSTLKLIFTILSKFDGSVIGTRYKSNNQCNLVWGAAISGDYVLASVSDTYHYLILFNIAKDTIITKKFLGTALYSCSAELDVGRYRIIIAGSYSNGYITKFLPESIDVHSDFTTTSFTMNVISTGTNDIISGNWITITIPALDTISALVKTNQTLTYNLKIRISFIISTQNISIMEWNSKQIIPDLA